MTFEEGRLVITLKNPESTKTWRLFHVHKAGEKLDINKVKKILMDALIDEGYDIGLEN